MAHDGYCAVDVACDETAEEEYEGVSGWAKA